MDVAVCKIICLGPRKRGEMVQPLLAGLPTIFLKSDKIDSIFRQS